MSYHTFAQYYDILTENIDYSARARYFQELLHRHGVSPSVLLDLACGTGSLTYALQNLGFTVIGVDVSPEMLTEAWGKAGEGDAPLFLLQSMETFQLTESVDAVICALDSLNHLPHQEALFQVFERVYEALTPDGYFIFDVNTEYKHEALLGNQTYVYDYPEVFCVWQNEYQEDTQEVEIQLDFFEEQLDGSYERSQENFSERVFSHECIVEGLEKAGLSFVEVLGEDSFLPPVSKEQRLIYVARK